MKKNILVTLFYIFFIFSSVSTFVFVGLYSNYGFDFTDESFYLLSISTPSQWHINVPLSFFGYIYNPIYTILDGKISHLRLFNITASFILCFTLCSVIYSELELENKNKLKKYGILLTISSTSLFNIGPWILTPSYNSLTLQSILVCSIGLVLTTGEKNREWKVYTGLVLIAVGGAIAFLAKPSSAALLSIAVLAVIYFVNRERIKFALLSGGLSFLIVMAFAWTVEGSLASFLYRVVLSVDAIKILGSGQEITKIFRIDPLEINLEIYYLACFFIFSNIVLTIETKNRAIKILIFVSFIFTLLFIITNNFTPTNPAIFILISTSFIIISAAFSYKENLNNNKKRLFILSIYFLFIPYAYAFGTNSNYWQQGTHITFSWIISILLAASLINKIRNNHYFLISFLLLTQLSLTSFLINATNNPYRQPPSLIKNSERLEFPNNQEIVTSKETHDYLFDLKNQLRTKELVANTPFIDLTGQSPGVLYFLDAKSLGQPWMVGGYPGSDDLVTEVLKRESNSELKRAWLLIEPNGPRSISLNNVMSIIGANPSDYDVVGTLLTGKYAGGYPERRLQFILKPRTSP